MSLTNASIRDLTYVDRDQQIPDEKILGLYIRVSPGSKTWIVKKRFGGKIKKWVLGHFPGMNIDEARRAAQDYLLKISSGIDPAEQVRRNIEQELQEREERELTVKKCVEFYLSEKKLSDTTKKDIAQLKKKMSDRAFYKLSVTQIKKKDVLDEFRHHSKIGATQANKMFRYLRSSIEYSVALKLEEPIANPIKILSATKSWNENKAVDRMIEGSREQLVLFCKSVEEYRLQNKRGSSVIADWIYCSIFWGTRKSESISLKWSNIDFINNVITFENTKNKLDHYIPLCTHARSILERLKEDSKSIYVFESKIRDRVTKELTHIKEPKKAIEYIREKSGIYFSPHDMRRTFANKLDDFGAEERMIKNALNHTISNDVTQKNYLRKKSVEKMRHYFEENENYWNDLISEALCVMRAEQDTPAQLSNL